MPFYIKAYCEGTNKARAHNPHVTILPFLLTHPSILSITFTHNHPRQSAHALSFMPISVTIKQIIFEYFSKGHTVHYRLITGMRQSCLRSQWRSVDRENNPTKSDFYCLYVSSKKGAWVRSR